MNALAREVEDSVSAWPRSLPWPQVPSVQINWAKPTDDVGTLQGPTRFRLAHPNASPSFEFEIQFTAAQCEAFEAWYDAAVVPGGEVYLPWIGEGRILALTEYELSPVADGWKLHALAVQLYVDREYCDRHVCDAANAWRVPVIVDADADYPIILCALTEHVPRLIGQFFGWDAIALLTAQYDSTDRVTGDLSANDLWNGHTLGWFAELKDTVTADLTAIRTFIDIPDNWLRDAELARQRMTYIDDWTTLAWDELTCRLLKDKLPPPYPIVENRDWGLTRIIANNFPLEVYRAC